jgi:hypothetical protein
MALNQSFNCGLWVSFSLAFHISLKTSIFPSTLQCKARVRGKGGRIHFGSANLGPIRVSAEAAGSSPVVPAIHSKRVALISTKPSRTQKGTVP